MLKLAWKGVLAHKLRLGLTAIAIVLGVAFVSGTFVFTDTLDRAFTGLFDEINSSVDLYVRGETEFTGQVVPIPADVLDDVKEVPGIGNAIGTVQGFAQFIDNDGEPVGGQAPTFGFSWVPGAEDLSVLTLKEGRPPENAGEVMVDAGTASMNGFTIGQTVKVILVTGTEEFEIVGFAGFGEEDNLLGASLAIFDEPTAFRVFDAPNEYASVSAVGDGSVAIETLVDRVNDILPEGFEAVTAAVQSEDDQADFQEAIGFLSTALLVFAGIAVLVGSFIIYNTFSIIIAQRMKEMALLRAVGATSRQVTRMVVIEAIVVGLIASAVGVLAGIGLTILIRAAFEATGVSFPQGPLTIRPNTVIIGMTVGMAVTLFSAVIPARQASRIPPVAAITEATVGGPKSLRNRAIAATALSALGIVILFFGLFTSTDNPLPMVGLGAVVLFFGVAGLSPLIARRSARIIGAPLPRVYGVTGTLARENSVRRPRRTAATASALMIGVAVVSMVAILASSLKQSITEQITQNFGSVDFQIQASAFADPSQVGVSPAVSEQISQLPEVAVVSPMSFGFWKNENGSERQLISVDPATLDAVFVADVQTGSVAGLADGGVLLQVDTAADLGVTTGDSITMEFPLTGVEQVEVDGTFAGEGLSAYLIGNEFFAERFSNKLNFMVFVNLADGVDAEVGRAAVEAVLTDYPNVELSNQAEFIESQKSQIDILLTVINALLLLAIVIALLGIANTLALSIFERKRELGLLRAVGMTRRQVRRMIRWEAVITALYGALLGLVLGIALGWAMVKALEGEGLTFGFPYQLLTQYVIAAAIGGVVASIWPSIRGARTNVLEAISYE
ncbi:MAG: FtsX-like permease family protein [Acidimicrobiia bacterium]|nr:FtsX-like permease family protein [Acidimicrobiia bacterium]MBT8192410.1 FtsX-like permease family protein [Acidimicrobiia bacterium]NNF87888.1 FtsX-like permease family protein [Acidimicrobiia bacterium]NNJ48129.1 FtsX-like permease family protein [Acidimicrobiia bacterium]NNL14602.1 FtsX-like permease family protein [Acidimicrobiia bacterium]